MNEFLFFVTILANFFGVVLCYRLFGKAGIFGWAVVATIVANIEVLKCVDMFGLSVTLGNVIYGSMFLCTDILSEFHGEKEAKKCITYTFLFMIVSTILFQLSLFFVPNSADFASGHMKEIFSLVPRMTITSILCFWISNRVDIFLFQWIKKRCKYLWVRNNVATLLAQLLDSVLFCVIAFTGVYDGGTIIEIIITTYLIKIMIAACDTPFLYLAKALHKRGRIPA